jgi:outer membrane protein TolC
MYSIRAKVQSIYLGIILLDRQLELNDLLMSNLNRNLGEVRALAEGGIAGKSDIDQIKVSILSCEQQKVALDSDRKAYLRMLSLLTGEDMTDRTLTEPRPVMERTMEIRRPELALYEAQAMQLTAQKDQLSTSIWPRLNLNLQAGYGRPGLNMLSGTFDPYFLAGIRLQWNLGALYSLRNDRRKSDIESRRVEVSRESFIMNTSLEAIQKKSRVEKDIEILARDEEIIELRKSIREAGEEQYKGGVLKMNDYLSLLDEEFKARVNYNVHNIQYLMDLLDLNYTLGK